MFSFNSPNDMFSHKVGKVRKYALVKEVNLSIPSPSYISDVGLLLSKYNFITHCWKFNCYGKPLKKFKYINITGLILWLQYQRQTLILGMNSLHGPTNDTIHIKRQLISVEKVIF